MDKNKFYYTKKIDLSGWGNILWWFTFALVFIGFIAGMNNPTNINEIKQLTYDGLNDKQVFYIDNYGSYEAMSVSFLMYGFISTFVFFGLNIGATLSFLQPLDLLFTILFIVFMIEDLILLSFNISLTKFVIRKFQELIK